MVKQWWVENINSLNAELNPICHLLALLGAHHTFHVIRIRVKCYGWLFGAWFDEVMYTASIYGRLWCRLLRDGAVCTVHINGNSVLMHVIMYLWDNGVSWLNIRARGHISFVGLYKMLAKQVPVVPQFVLAGYSIKFLPCEINLKRDALFRRSIGDRSNWTPLLKIL
jgi:hypothetical protein